MLPNMTSQKETTMKPATLIIGTIATFILVAIIANNPNPGEAINLLAALLILPFVAAPWVAIPWLIAAFIVALLGRRRHRSGLGWFLLALAISPLLAGLLVLVLPARPSAAQIAAKLDKQAIADKFARLGTPELEQPPCEIRKTPAERSEIGKALLVVVGAIVVIFGLLFFFASQGHAAEEYEIPGSNYMIPGRDYEPGPSPGLVAVFINRCHDTTEGAQLCDLPGWPGGDFLRSIPHWLALEDGWVHKAAHDCLAQLDVLAKTHPGGPGLRFACGIKWGPWSGTYFGMTPPNP
jgi:hypothetical protein